MIEETGYRVGALQHVTSFYSSPGITTELMHLYRVTQLTPGSPTEESDQLEVVLVTLEVALGRIQQETAWDAKRCWRCCGMPVHWRIVQGEREDASEGGDSGNTAGCG
jgi:8-oxo-dGTP pyrophosphatase MutT (NUDIX family)